MQWRAKRVEHAPKPFSTSVLSATKAPVIHPSFPCYSGAASVRDAFCARFLIRLALPTRLFPSMIVTAGKLMPPCPVTLERAPHHLLPLFRAHDTRRTNSRQDERQRDTHSNVTKPDVSSNSGTRFVRARQDQRFPSCSMFRRLSGGSG